VSGAPSLAEASAIELEVAPGEPYCVYVRAKAVRGWLGTFIAAHQEVSTLARKVGSRHCATAPE
jgi:hypothetical protein